VSPKKTKRSPAAQQLIENLLDELPPSKVSSREGTSSPNYDQTPKVKPGDEGAREIAMFEGTGSFGDIEPEKSDRIVIDNDEGEVGTFDLETSGKNRAKATAPPFEGTSPVVTQMVQRTKIVRPETTMSTATKMPTTPPTPPLSAMPTKATTPQPAAPKQEERKRPVADVDFGSMSSEDEFNEKSDQPLPESDERTIRVAPGTLVSQPEPRSEVIPISRSIDRGGATEIRPGIKIPPSPKVSQGGVGGGSPYTSVEASLKQSESLRIAQSRITDLERELERVRRDNESLSTAGDTLRRRADELSSKAESLEIVAREANLRLDEEKKVLRGQIQAKDRENSEMKARVEEIETRLESNFKKIRVRERELEHRLEIVKMESATLVTTKDKMLLDLKRQIDQLHQESDSAKNKSQELFGQYKEKQDTIRRVVRALRIALTILEGDDETVVPFKKAE
jgi:hypothetical protein